MSARSHISGPILLVCLLEPLSFALKLVPMNSLSVSRSKISLVHSSHTFQSRSRRTTGTSTRAPVGSYLLSTAIKEPQLPIQMFYFVAQSTVKCVTTFLWLEFFVKSPLPSPGPAGPSSHQSFRQRKIGSETEDITHFWEASRRCQGFVKP